MIELSGNWYDGKSSNRMAVKLNMDRSNAVRIQTNAEGALIYQQTVFQARVSNRLADTPRLLTFPGGEVLETADNATVDQILAQTAQGHWSQWIHRLESKLVYVLAACLIVVLIAAGAVKYGVPSAARIIAAKLPSSIYQTADRQTLTMLDRMILKPSELDLQVQVRIQPRLQQVMDDYSSLPLKLELRKGGKLGPNAFALPGGTIVFTDEMVRVAQHDNELVTVMAHEIGHVYHQHGMRRMVQNSLVSFVLLAVTGDASGVSELFLGLPVLLTELAYSREFEREADQFAAAYLERADISPSHFADLLIRIEKQHENQEGSEGNRWTGYLSTHPPTDERVQAFHHSGERWPIEHKDDL